MKALAPIAVLLLFLAVLAGVSHMSRELSEGDGTREILVDDEPKTLAWREIWVELDAMVRNQVRKTDDPTERSAD